MTNLSFSNEFLESSDYVLDRNRLIHAVLVVQIDVIHAQALEGLLHGITNICRGGIHTKFAVRPLAGHETKLGGNNDLVSVSFEGLAHENFVLEGAIDFSSVEECHTEI